MPAAEFTEVGLNTAQLTCGPGEISRLITITSLPHSFQVASEPVTAPLNHSFGDG